MMSNANPRDMPAESRLSRMINRLTTQRACLEFAAAQVQGIPGAVVELGLGKGRTFDHLRRLMPEREIHVFDREVHAPSDCVPAEPLLHLGDFSLSLPSFVARYTGRIAMLHADVGSENRVRDAETVAMLTPLVMKLVCPAAIVLSDREFTVSDWETIELPELTERWPYYLYRVGRWNAT